MLDLSHPMTKHVFRASHLMADVMKRGQRMSVAPSKLRLQLLSECESRFEEMRQLAHAHFSGQSEFICKAIEELQSAIRELAHLKNGEIAEDRQDGRGKCAACGTAITSIPKYQIVLCRECVKPFMSAYQKLDSEEGFGTWAI